MNKLFMTKLLSAMTFLKNLSNYNYKNRGYVVVKGNPTRWRSVKQDLQTQSQKRHRADKRINNV